MNGRFTFVLLLSCILLGGCAEDPTWPNPCPGSLDSSGGAENILNPNIPDTYDPRLIAEGHPGAPCEMNSDCVTHYCMTTQLIGTLIPGTEVPGGYCSELMCPVDGASGLCGADEVGGICFSLFPFVASMGELGICLAPCADDRDCRPDEDVICFDATSLVTKGLLAQDMLEQYYPAATAGCLPRSIAEAAEEALQP